MNEEVYDSTNDTKQHINRVRLYLIGYALDLGHRGMEHDKSKLESPEKEYFDKYTPRLAGMVFGSPEYTQNIQDLKPALEHHYKNNSHHPQFYEKGVNGMNLFDLIEMFADWKASGERGKDGNIFKSIDINAERFGISKQLKQILINTANYLKYEQQGLQEADNGSSK